MKIYIYIITKKKGQDSRSSFKTRTDSRGLYRKHAPTNKLLSRDPQRSVAFKAHLHLHRRDAKAPCLQGSVQKSILQQCKLMIQQIPFSPVFSPPPFSSICCCPPSLPLCDPLLRHRNEKQLKAQQRWASSAALILINNTAC